MAPEDPLAVSPSVRPTSGVVAWAVEGVYCAAPSDTTMAVSGCSWLGAVTATSTNDTGSLAGGAAPTTEDTACSATTEGAGVAGSANEATTSESLLPEIGVTSGTTVRPA